MRGGSCHYYGGTAAQRRAAKRLRGRGLSYYRIGETLGVNWQTARKWVLDLSAPSSRDPIDWASVDLGARSDSEIARSLGVSYQAVQYQRRKLGILPYRCPPSADEAPARNAPHPRRACGLDPRKDYDPCPPPRDLSRPLPR